MATTSSAPTNCGGLGNGMSMKRHPEPIRKQRIRPKMGLIMSSSRRNSRNVLGVGRSLIGFGHKMVGCQVAEGHEQDQQGTHEFRRTRGRNIKPTASCANCQTKQNPND